MILDHDLTRLPNPDSRPDNDLQLRTMSLAGFRTLLRTSRAGSRTFSLSPVVRSEVPATVGTLHVRPLSSPSAQLSRLLLARTCLVWMLTPSLLVATSKQPKKPIGPFRGGLLGFLFGFSLASALASYHLWEEYKTASALLLLSVQELEGSVAKVRFPFSLCLRTSVKRQSAD